MNLNVDLGQISIVTTIALVGWLLSNKISNIEKRLDNHENRIYALWQNSADRKFAHLKDSADDQH